MSQNNQIKYIGNNTWQVNGQHAVIAAWGSSDLRVPATGEIVALTADQAKEIRAEWDNAKADRQVSKASKAPTAKAVTADNLAYHMYSRHGSLFG